MILTKERRDLKMGKKILKFSLDIIIIACLVAAGYFGLKIFERFQEDQQLNSSYESIRKDTKTGKHINWNKLKKINSDIVAWIYVKGTNIDYPVVQGKTNQSYLHTNFKKQYTYGGCIFLDSKDNKQFALNDNNVFYGHHMRNGSMFADLVKFREEKFARKHTIELYTPDKIYHLKAFSAYAKTADTSIPITFKNQEEKNAYITKLKNRNGVSSIIKNIPKKDEPIYTFATCSYEGHDYRTYVHAVEK